MNRSHHSNNDRGFSLLELMVVVVITAVLAAVALPIYGKSVKKAKQAEADVALGSIRGQLRIYYAEYGQYPPGLDVSVIDADWSYLEPGELTNSYFSDDSYTYSALGSQYYLLRCSGGDVMNYDRTLDQDGNFGESTHTDGGIWALILSWLGY